MPMIGMALRKLRAASEGPGKGNTTGAFLFAPAEFYRPVGYTRGHEKQAVPNRAGAPAVENRPIADRRTPDRCRAGIGQRVFYVPASPVSCDHSVLLSHRGAQR